MRCNISTGLAAAFALAILLTAAPEPVRADTVIQVDSISGESDVPDACTLRDAITAANSDAAVGGCPAGDGADTIFLPKEALITLTELDNDNLGHNGLPTITTTIRIEGNGSTIERYPVPECAPAIGWSNEGEVDGEGKFRLLHVGNGGDLTLRHVTLQHGCPIGPFPSDRSGGAIAVFNGGRLTLEHSILRDNTAGESGGALYHNSALESEVSFSEFRNNRSLSNGGAIENSGGVTRIDNSLIANNIADNSGGGLFVSMGQLIISNTTISANSSEYTGGGIATSNTTFSAHPVVLTLIQSTLSGNASGNRGGAISSSASLDIRFSSLIDNHSRDGDAIYFNYNFTEADSRTITGSILTGTGELCDGPTLDTLQALGENLATDDSCPGFTKIHSEPMVAPLGQNGGAAPTHALLPGSPAIDAVDDCPLELTIDQRGRPRPGAGSAKCDLGAYEFQSPLIFQDHFEADPGAPGSSLKNPTGSRP